METITPTNNNTKRAEWFANIVQTLQIHEAELETNTAPVEVKNFYDKLISGDLIELGKENIERFSRYFISSLIGDYMTLIQHNLPKKLAFDLSGSEVLVWAEIQDNDEELEHKLIMAEAKVNAKYHDLGFDLTTTIVESDEQLKIPNHYSILSLK